jgi:PAS domain S-box-containing protein
MWFFNKKSAVRSNNEETQNERILASQLALIEAATSTTQMANYVTTTLKNKLDDSIEQFENTSKILYDALIITDIDGNLQAFNPAAERMFGLSKEEHTNTFLGNLLSCETHPTKTGADIWEVFQQMEDAQEEHELFGKKGSKTFRIDVNHTILERSDGSVIVLMVIKKLMDFETEYQRTHGYKCIFETFPDGILVIKNQKIAAANSVAARILGFPIETLLSKRMEDVTNSAICEESGMIDTSFTSTKIMWQGEEALLLTIRDLSTAIQDKRNMICCFGADFKLTFLNASFLEVYSAKIGDDIRMILPDDEKHAMLININKLTNIESSRTIRLSNEAKTQVWTDYYNESNGEIEYQRIGKIL